MRIPLEIGSARAGINRLWARRKIADLMDRKARGASEDEIRRQIVDVATAHLDGTAPPGGNGVCVIAGHRDTHFAVLEDLKTGELVLVEDGYGGRHAFRVRKTLVVGDRDWWALNPGGGVELVLLTCWPFDGLGATGARRYVIWADRCLLSEGVKTLDLR